MEKPNQMNMDELPSIGGEEKIDWSSLDGDLLDCFNAVEVPPVEESIVEEKKPQVSKEVADSNDLTYEEFVQRNSDDGGVLDIFIEEAVEFSSTILNLWDNIKKNPLQSPEELKELKRCLHSFKGISGTVGLSKLMLLLHETEEVLKLYEEKRVDFEIIKQEISNTLFDVEGWVTWCQFPNCPTPSLSNLGSLIKKIILGEEVEVITDDVKVDDIAKEDVIQATPIEIKPEIKEVVEVKKTTSAKKITPDFASKVAGGDGNLGKIIKKARELNKNKLVVRDEKEKPFNGHKTEEATAKLTAKNVHILLQEMGMWGATQASLDSQHGTLVRILSEFTEHIDKMHKLLQEVKISAEAQMSARRTEVEVSGNRFDPLEMDRFTRLQDSTRILSEGVEDLKNVQSEMNSYVKQTADAISQQAKSARSIQEVLEEVRLVSLNYLVPVLKMSVSTAAATANKRATLIVEGADIKIDRTILEKMREPLDHLLKNAIAHGIESPEERIKKGKDPMGKITLSASSNDKTIVIRLYDDGAGLNYAKIRQKAIENNLILPDAEVSETELRSLILSQSFSTADQVSTIAGRGVGLDVVKASVEGMGGRLGISSEEGKGAVFELEIPPTILTTQALHVEANNTNWCLPAQYWVMFHELRREEIVEAYKTGTYKGKEFVYFNDILSKQKVEPSPNEFGNMVAEFAQNDRHLYVYIDKLTGRDAVVLKSLKYPLNKIDGLIGVAYLGEGRLNPMLNPFTLVNKKRQYKNTEPAQTEKIVEETIEEQKIKVMVVDDSSTVRKVTSNLLKNKNMEVFLAKDGVDALEQLQNITPDIMLIDLEMPRMNGFELTENVRKDKKLCHIPIVMITSRTADKHQETAKEKGINAYLGKPYQDYELLTQIEEWTGRKIK